MLNTSGETGFIAGVDVIKGSRSTCDGEYLADNKTKKKGIRLQENESTICLFELQSL